MPSPMIALIKLVIECVAICAFWVAAYLVLNWD